MKVYRNPKTGFVFVQDSVGIYPFQFEKDLTNRAIKGKLRKWGITTSKKVDAKKFNAVKVDLTNKALEEI